MQHPVLNSIDTWQASLWKILDLIYLLQNESKIRKHAQIAEHSNARIAFPGLGWQTDGHQCHRRRYSEQHDISSNLHESLHAAVSLVKAELPEDLLIKWPVTLKT